MKKAKPAKEWDPLAEKRQARQRDRIRLAKGLVTVDELQQENAFIQNAREARIVDKNPANRLV